MTETNSSKTPKDTHSISSTNSTSFDQVSNEHLNLPPRTFKVIVLGNSSVGKTCLTYRFCQRNFLIQTEATIGVDFRERLIELSEKPKRRPEPEKPTGGEADGTQSDPANAQLSAPESSPQKPKTRQIKLQLWDTAGQERYRTSMVPHYYRNAHAVVFVYDVTRPKTFQDLEGWIKECDEYLDETSDNGDIPRCVVGNKIDLISSLTENDSFVPTDLAQRFADIHNMPLFETSAREDSQMDNVDAIFITLAHKLKDSKPFISRNEGGRNVKVGEGSDGGSSGFGCC